VNIPGIPVHFTGTSLLFQFTQALLILREIFCADSRAFSTAQDSFNCSGGKFRITQILSNIKVKFQHYGDFCRSFPQYLVLSSLVFSWLVGRKTAIISFHFL